MTWLNQHVQYDMPTTVKKFKQSAHKNISLWHTKHCTVTFLLFPGANTLQLQPISSAKTVSRKHTSVCYTNISYIQYMHNNVSTCHFGHFNHFCYLLLLTYLQCTPWQTVMSDVTVFSISVILFLLNYFQRQLLGTR